MSAIQMPIGLGPPFFKAAQATPVPTVVVIVVNMMIPSPTMTALTILASTIPARTPLIDTIAVIDAMAAMTNAVVMYFFRLGVSAPWEETTHCGHRWRLGGKKKSQVTQDPLPHILQNETGGSRGCWGHPRSAVAVGTAWKLETDGVTATGACDCGWL